MVRVGRKQITTKKTNNREQQRQVKEQKAHKKVSKQNVPVGQPVKEIVYKVEAKEGQPAEIRTTEEGNVQIICTGCTINQYTNITVTGDNNGAISAEGPAVTTSGKDADVNITGEGGHINITYGDNSPITQVFISKLAAYNLSNDEIQAVYDAQMEVQANVPEGFTSLASKMYQRMDMPELAEKYRLPATIDELLAEPKFNQLNVETQRLLLKTIKYPNSIMQLLAAGFDNDSNISFDKENNRLIMENKDGISLQIDVSNNEYLRNIQCGYCDLGDSELLAIDGGKYEITYKPNNKGRQVLVGSRSKVDAINLIQTGPKDSFNIEKTLPNQFLIGEKKNSVQEIPIHIPDGEIGQISNGYQHLSFKGNPRFYYDGENSLILKN